MHRVEDVFGVRSEAVLSYIERSAVDVAFGNALRTTKHIVVYGASKQGKTALLRRSVSEAKRTIVHASPKSTRKQIYQTLLRTMGVELTSGVDVSNTFVVRANFGGESAGGGVQYSRSAKKQSKTVDVDLSVAQDVGDLILEVRGSNHFIVLENFHYLDETTQREMAFDLRTFEDIGIRFIILGVWNEANRLASFNRDLQDRLEEVPVEPWLDADFKRVLQEGATHLRIQFSDGITSRIVAVANGSIAVVQELAKLTVRNAGLEQEYIGQGNFQIDDKASLESAISTKAREYSNNHLKSLKAVAAGIRPRVESAVRNSLYQYHYIVAALLTLEVKALRSGIDRGDLAQIVKKLHPNPDSITAAALKSPLENLARLQDSKGIQPPLVDYSENSRRLRVLDPTLFFVLENLDRSSMLEELDPPGVPATIGEPGREMEG